MMKVLWFKINKTKRVVPGIKLKVWWMFCRVGIFLYLVGSFNFISAWAQTAILFPQEIEQIGIKVFENECAGKDECLLKWNEGEDFLSLGIGHFLWYSEGKEGPFEESFPIFVKYLENWKGIPDWLTKKPFPKCPWTSREDFLKNRQNSFGEDLYKFLIETKFQQSVFLVARLETALPLMLHNLPMERHDEIKKQFNRVASTPPGVFALIDYINFKGLGISQSERYHGQGWGLTQILSEMSGHEEGSKAIEEFVHAANKALTERINNSPKDRQEQKWLAGWQNRVRSYLVRKEI